MLQLKLFGHFEIRGASAILSNAKLRGLLAYLALSEPRGETRDRLTTLLWGSSPEEQALLSFRQALTRLRKAVGPETILIRDQFVKLSHDHITSDVGRFEHLVRAGSKEALGEAVGLADGELLSGVDVREPAWEHWLAGERRRLARLVSDALFALAEIEYQDGDTAIALRHAEALIRRDFLREDAHRLVMRSLAKLGRRSEALTHYKEFSDHLRKELDTTAEAATVECYELVRESSRDASKTGPDKSAIAVLPFLNMGRDPDQQYFSDGVTADIITELSRFRSLFVIARNSSFKYRASDVDVRQVGRELGVHYVVEGSVRRADERLRIAALLVDTKTGEHVWAERYDRDMRDLFAVQDEVARTIATTLEGRIAASAVEKVKRKPTKDWKVYDYFLHGRAQDAQDDAAAAESFFSRAAELEPDYSPAHAFRAIALAGMYRASADPELLQRAQTSAEVALSLDAHDAWSHWAAGFVAMSQRKFDLAGVHLNRAMSLNPNDVLIAADHANWLVRTGKPEEALQRLDAAMRRDPFPASWVWEIRFRALYQLKRYDESVTALSNVSKHVSWHSINFAAAYACAGRPDDARAAVARCLEEIPGVSIALVAEVEPYSDRQLLAHLLDGLRKAGLPE